MSLWKWFKQTFLGAPRERDVSRLETPGQDQTVEKIEVRGGPLKPHHRRLQIRDPRLLPKIKMVRRPEMKFEEAQRLFSASMLTRNRGIRDLAEDPEQLARLGLPLWKSEQDVANALGITLKQLWFYSLHREGEQTRHYVTFAVPKKRGGERLLHAPKKRLKAVQRRLKELLVDKLPVSQFAHGFRKQRNVRTGAAQHAGSAVVLNLDLENFFPSITFARVRGLLIAYGYGYPVATSIALLVTEAERQPVDYQSVLYYVPVTPRYCVQGAPTSPGLSNAMVLRLDRRLNGLARKFGGRYSRYADDLTFSGLPDHKTAWGLYLRARAVVESEGFRVNPDKTRLMGRGRRQSVTGVVVNRDVGLSRVDRRKLRAALHHLKQGKLSLAEVARLRGKLAYLWMLNREQALKLWPAEWKLPT